MELELREHQIEVIDALREGFRQGHRSQLLYAPTGFGKTEVAIYLMKATADKYKRAAMVLDRIVLVDQNLLHTMKLNLTPLNVFDVEKTRRSKWVWLENALKWQHNKAYS